MNAKIAEKLSHVALNRVQASVRTRAARTTCPSGEGANFLAQWATRALSRPRPRRYRYDSGTAPSKTPIGRWMSQTERREEHGCTPHGSGLLQDLTSS
jgi:hypothetical protein